MAEPADEFGRSVVQNCWRDLMELTVSGDVAIERMDEIARWNTPTELYELFSERNEAINRYRNRRWVSESVCVEVQRLMDRLDYARNSLGEKFWTLEALRTSSEWEGIRQHATALSVALKDWAEAVGLRVNPDNLFDVELDHLR